jgi:hypothetical protein
MTRARRATPLLLATAIAAATLGLSAIRVSTQADAKPTNDLPNAY